MLNSSSQSVSGSSSAASATLTPAVTFEPQYLLDTEGFSKLEKSTHIARAHFIGIGGAGMSGIALVLHERGCVVTGSDLKASHYVRELEDAGIHVHIGHTKDTIEAAKPDVVVVSSAILQTNPELVYAKEHGIAIWPRAKMLSYLSLHAKTIAVAGTHGKTTTSSMIATMLDHMGDDPSFLIGGIVEEYKTNGRSGKSDYFVCEADESDGSFMYLNPHVAVITNIEADHLDHYKTFDNLTRTFAAFMDLVGSDGTVVICGDNPTCRALAQASSRHVVTYGFDAASDYVCTLGANTHTITNSFQVRCPSGEELAITLTANPGVHNALNATAAIAAAGALGLDVHAAAKALCTFKGAHRRFTHMGTWNDICVVDDYGHHPTEIKATLAAAKNLQFKRIVCVFQPHRYTRTQALMNEFADAFVDADVVIVTDVFSAGETPIPGVTGQHVAQLIAKQHPSCITESIPQKKAVVNRLIELLQPGDLLITQGAGDVVSIGSSYLERVQGK